MLECALQPMISKYPLPNESNKPKYGVYLQSMYWGIKGYAKKVWVVAVKINLDYDKAKEEYETDDEIVRKCIEFLNVPPKSKYGRRRQRRPLYTFEPDPHDYEITETHISAKLKIRDRKNKHFWKTGPLV
tara:strand:+ start:547 stop:936 length:390 start_codon:yes stop_codon:yes gene_type:complete